MGKAIKLNNKKTGEMLYPLTASDLVFDPTTKKSVKADLAEKIGDAPSDGKQYVRKDGEWIEQEAATMDFFQLFIHSNQDEDGIIDSVKATVKIDGESIMLGNGESVVLEKGSQVVISFPEVEDYKKPDEIDFTFQGGLVSKTGTYRTEVVAVNVTADTGDSMDGVTVTINGTTHTYNGSYVSQKVAFGVAYIVSVSDKDGYIKPSSKTFTASQTVRNLTLEFEKIMPKITTIVIDQSISDPAGMVTRTVDGGGIEAIRANSHRYTGTVNVNGIMELKQIDDVDGTKYVDGTNAVLTTQGVDVWMKLPRFWYKCSNSANKTTFSVAYGIQPDSSYKEWDGKDLIGVYKANVGHTAVGEDLVYKLYSNSEEALFKSNTYTEYKSYIANRGDGFSLVKWKHHCMMGMLFLAYYMNTNSQAILGHGLNTGATGSSNKLCMQDTAMDNLIVNFWGLEGWFSYGSEFIGNIRLDDGHIFYVTEDDGTERYVGNSYAGADYISKLQFGENIDLNPSAVVGSLSTGFCDYWTYTTGRATALSRSYYMNSDESGMFYLGAIESDSTGSTRIAYRGDFVIVD